MALAAFAIISGIAATVAQIIGGLLITADLFGLGWRSIFLVNVPVGLVALAAAQIWVSESRAPEADRHSLDMIGVLLLLLPLGSLTAPLTLGSEQGWPSWSLVSLALVPLLGGLLAGWLRRRQSMGRAPLVELSLLTKRRFVAGNLMAMLFYASNAALFVALPVFVQSGLGHSPLTSGLLFAPLALVFSATSAWAGDLTARHGYGLVAVGGLLLLAAYGCLALAASAGNLQISGWPLLPGLILAGTGMGFVQPTISYTALEPVAPAEVGSASGVLNTSFELGYGLGSVVAGMFSFSAAGVAETIAGCLYLTSGLVILMMVTSYACRQPILSLRTGRQWSADSAR
nr:MFS transporter [Microvirga pakistanensis]